MDVVIVIDINYLSMNALTQYALPSFICHQRIGEDFDYLSILFIYAVKGQMQSFTLYQSKEEIVAIFEDPLYRPTLLL